MDNHLKDHWEDVYSKKETTHLGWYEDIPQPSLDMIENCHLPINAPILDVGVGTSILIDHLIDRGYSYITAVDISAQAIEKLKARLGNEKSNRVQWLVDDITHPQKINQLKDIALWHDRAVLHFLNEREERQTYLATMRKVLRSGGYAIIAAFSLEGAASCSGLPVFRYSKEILVEFLGDGFELMESFDYLYHQPWGDPRPYVYTRFQKSA